MFDNVCKFLAESCSADFADARLRHNVAASTAVLAGLVLEKRLIQLILRSNLMRESVIYQDILAEGRAEGLQQGLQQGLQEGLQQGLQQASRQMALKLLQHGMPIEEVVEITEHSIEQIQQWQVEENQEQ